jgi:hypothetical protein
MYNNSMEEAKHIAEVLEATKQALTSQDSIKLKELSNQTIHCASIEQDNGSIMIAVLVYSLSKILERKENMKIKNWNEFMKKIISYLSMATVAALEGNEIAYEQHLERARKTLNSLSINLKPYIQEVVRKASINKASKIYEHGISLGKTASLLGISEWELTDYIGQSKASESTFIRSMDVKKRIQIAMEFFS